MAENVQSLVSTGATLAVGTGVVFDSVTIGASTGNVEYVKLMSGSSGSTVTVPASSAPLGAIGLHVAVVNSTTQPIGVNLTGGQSSVSVTGNVNTIVSNTTASPGLVQLVQSNALVSTANPVAVLLQGSTATVTIQGNASVSLTTASKMQVELSTTLGGFSSASPIVAFAHAPVAAAGWESISTVATSTAICVLFSSAASTRHNLTTLVITNAGTAESVIRIFDGAATSAGLLFRTDLSSAGGGIAISLPVPIRGSSGAAVVAKTVPASTVYINAVGYKTA